MGNGTAEMVGRNVRARREALGWSGAELAKRATKMDRSHLWRIERGDVEPTLETLGRLAVALGTNVGALLIRSDDRRGSSRVTAEPGGSTKPRGKKSARQ